jgi:hypothetical protein
MSLTKSYISSNYLLQEKICITLISVVAYEIEVFKKMKTNIAEIKDKLIGISILLGIPILVIIYFTFFTAEYRARMSFCGIGKLMMQSDGGGRNRNGPDTLMHESKCEPNEPTENLGAAGSIARLNTFFGMSATATFEGEGEGIIKVSILKNGKLCDEKIVPGKGKFTTKATCY